MIRVAGIAPARAIDPETTTDRVTWAIASEVDDALWLEWHDGYWIWHMDLLTHVSNEVDRLTETEEEFR